MKELSKTPRLFVESPLALEKNVELTKQQSHYVRNVLRLHAGSSLRLFNGSEGEWVASVTEKPSMVEVLSLLRPQTHKSGPWVFFTPLKKDRMDFLIEKAVELGVSKLCPILTDRTIVRKFHHERALAQCIEASEQSERLDVPSIASLTPLHKIFEIFPAGIPLYLCEERSPLLPTFDTLTVSDACAILVGPEGGLTDKEKEWIKSHEHVQCVSLSENILRSETAVLCALSQMKITR